MDQAWVQWEDWAKEVQQSPLAVGPISAGETFF